MRFITVQPKWPNITVLFEQYRDHHLALRSVGLDPLKCDHGIVRVTMNGGISVIVGEFGLFDPQAELWLCCGRMFAGPAILYQFDERGDMVDLDKLRYGDPIHDFGIVPVNRAAAMELIEAGTIARPQHRLNGEVMWQWPDPMPEYLRRAVS